MEKTLQELADFVDGKVVGDPCISIRGASGIKEAGSGQITFVANPKYSSLLVACQASAVIVSHEFKEISLPCIKTANPYLAFAKVLHLFYDQPYVSSGIHSQAVVDISAQIGEKVSIHPFAVIGKEVKIGHSVRIFSGSYIGDYSQIGDESVIYPNVTIYPLCCVGSRVIIHAGTVIGSDGFGYIWDGKEHYKIPQVGRVVIEDDVEIGSGTTIDRGTISDTVIKRGTKIDNLVQIAHNVVIGESSIIVSQTGIAGSAEVGKGVTLGGQVGVAGHLKIGDHTIAAAKTGITKNVPPNSIIGGNMAQPIREWRKAEVTLRRLPEISHEIQKLRKKVQDLEEKLANFSS